MNARQKEIVGIVGGKGKMGRFFAHMFQKQGFEVFISDKRSKISNTELAKKSDIVLISVPIDVTTSVIREVGPHIKKEGLIMDVTSLKAPIVQEMMRSTNCSVLGCHPMFAPSNSMEAQVCIFCEGRGKKWQKRIVDIFEKENALVRFLDAEKHDELMTVIQGLMHFLDVTAARTLQSTGIPIEKYFEFRSPSYRLKLDLMGRTLYQDARLYGHIQMQNPKTSKILEKFLENARELTNVIEEKNFRKFSEFWESCREYLGDFASVCQNESDEVINFLSAAKTHAKTSWGRQQQKKKGGLGLLGPENTFSHLAAKRFLPEEEDIVFYRTLPEIFDAFSQKECRHILVPMENRIEGSIGQTLDGLFNSHQMIQALFRMPIHFVLAGLPGSRIELIQQISSHSQPLAQCSKFLSKSVPNADLVPVTSTAYAIQELLRSGKKHHAVICSEEAVENAGLQILSRDISNLTENETRFAFLSSQKMNFTPKKSFPISSIVFYFDQDAPGTLASVLEEFSKANINLTKIESRPAGHMFGEYVFFLDFEGSIYNARTQDVLQKVSEKGAHVKMLGSYPVISEV
ncbi:prephenate dehydratase [Candidatus Peregrinibacteria bacterium]|nr:prephenate dehydratase [Candidatus Peregrinibacteria bacterium]